jgi:hypothetical protein
MTSQWSLLAAAAVCMLAAAAIPAQARDLEQTAAGAAAAGKSGPHHACVGWNRIISTCMHAIPAGCFPAVLATLRSPFASFCQCLMPFLQEHHLPFRTTLHSSSSLQEW